MFRLGSSRFGLEDPPLLDSLDVTRFCGVYLDFVAVAYEWGDVYYQAGFQFGLLHYGAGCGFLDAWLCVYHR